LTYFFLRTATKLFPKTFSKCRFSLNLQHDVIKAEAWALNNQTMVSVAKLTVVVEPVEGDFSILADLDEVAVGITHVAAPFPAVIV